MDKPSKLIEWGFDEEWIDIPMEALHPLKPLPPTIKLSVKFLQIRSSVEAIGLV